MEEDLIEALEAVTLAAQTAAAAADAASDDLSNIAVQAANSASQAAQSALDAATNSARYRSAYGGTANAITLNSGMGISGTPPTGLQLRFRASAANTGATTIALDGGSAIACRTVTGVALPSGYIRTNAETVAFYDGTFWVLNREEERGSNANGSFTRFETGLLICDQNFSGINVNAALGNIFRSSVLTSWTYPAAFASPPKLAGSTGDTAAWPTPAYGSASVANMRFCGGVALSGITAALTATGRWY